MKKALFVFIVFAVLGVFLSMLGLKSALFPDANAPTAIVVVPEGANAKRISSLLHTKNVLPVHPLVFRLYLKAKGLSTSLRPGQYRLKQPTPMGELLAKLLKGSIVLVSVTMPEGSTLSEVVSFVARKKIATAEAMKEALKNKKLQEELKVPGPSFEGFLFPETYKFEKNTPAPKVVRTMVNHFFSQISEADQAQAERIGFSLLEWITLASIIDKESGSMTKEHRIISSVFHNRLKKRMRLQTDPTVIYGVPNFDGNLTRKHLLTPGPYNTYLNYGLPPGPIANPGLSAIKAAINPAKTDYLYFVAKGNGEHYFSKDYKTHTQAVRKYQLRR